jgi:predicted nucleotidyltransferase
MPDAFKYMPNPVTYTPFLRIFSNDTEENGKKTVKPGNGRNVTHEETDMGFRGPDGAGTFTKGIPVTSLLPPLFPVDLQLHKSESLERRSLPIWTPCFPNLLEKRRLLAQNNGMDQRFVIEKLRHHEPELKAAGILHIRVFGSVARNEATTVSDVDLLADFDKSKRLTLVEVGSVQSRLSAMLGARVDLSSTEWMRDPVKSKAFREAVIAF